MKTFREYLAESKINEKEIVAGPGVYANMKVGDKVVDDEGKEITSINPKFVKTICLNNKTASVDKNGNVQLEGINHANKKEIFITLTKEEIEAIKKL
jgi:hypothetical protein